MNGRTRWLFVTPLLLVFGGKLLATGYLLWAMSHSSAGLKWKLPLCVGLGSLAALHLAIIVGIVLRRKTARRVGDRLCLVGVFTGSALIILGPCTIYLALFAITAGLFLFFFNGSALLLLRSQAIREWCDVEGGEMLLSVGMLLGLLGRDGLPGNGLSVWKAAARSEIIVVAELLRMGVRFDFPGGTLWLGAELNPSVVFKGRADEKNLANLSLAVLEDEVRPKEGEQYLFFIERPKAKPEPRVIKVLPKTEEILLDVKGCLDAP